MYGKEKIIYKNLNCILGLQQTDKFPRNKKKIQFFMNQHNILSKNKNDLTPTSRHQNNSIHFQIYLFSSVLHIAF